MAQPLWQSSTRRILAWEVRGGSVSHLCTEEHRGAQRRKQPAAEQHSLASESRLSSSHLTLMILFILTCASVLLVQLGAARLYVAPQCR